MEGKDNSELTRGLRNQIHEVGVANVVIGQTIDTQNGPKLSTQPSAHKFTTSRKENDIKYQGALSPVASYNARVVPKLKERRSSHHSKKLSKQRSSNDEALEGKLCTLSYRTHSLL
jgi:hypothetical protein